MKELLLEFLKKTGRKSEFKLFLNLFQNIPKKQFALIKISGETLENHLDTIAEDIAFLNKLGLYPLIVHGGGTSLNKELVNSQKIDGIRVTPAEDVAVVKSVFGDISRKLKEKIIEKGGKAEIVEGAIQADYLDKEKYGSVGKVMSIQAEKLEAVWQDNATPVISPLGMHKWEKSVMLNINADTVAKELVCEFGIQKLIFITETGGVLNNNGEVIPFINLLSDDDTSFIKGGMLVKVNEIREFLNTNINTDVVICSAAHLLQEIFTIKGCGTFFKNYAIKSANISSDINREEMKNLLENAFAKKLKSGYLDKPFKEIIYQKDYEAAAVVSEIASVSYLCKFAVADFRQGTGLGKAVWNQLVSKHPKLIWRSQAKNKANGFYLSRCSGMMKKGKWYVFWLNLSDEEVMHAIGKVLDKKESFLEEK